jgi:CheY-like chemotaxis protein
MYAEALRRRGFCTLQAASAADGLRLARELSPAIVVTGVRLEGAENGFELTRRLKTEPDTREVPVVVLTGCVFADDREAAASSGCDLFLLKPCLPAILSRTLEQLLTGDVPARDLGSNSKDSYEYAL